MVQPLTLLHNIFDRKGTPFVQLLLINSTLSHTQFNTLHPLTNALLRSQCRRHVALGTGDRQVNHSEALGIQQDSMVFIKITSSLIITALEVKTRKKRDFYVRRNKNYDYAPYTKKEGKTNYKIYRCDLHLILSPGVRTPNLLQL